MIKIESLKDYANKKEQEDLGNKIYNLISFADTDYPNYKDWFFEKQLFETINSENRNIFFVRNSNNKDEIIAVACLKNNNEKKICTLYVLNKFRGQGIGNRLIEKSMDWLGTTKPLVTLTDYKYEMFKPIIDKYNWELTEVVNDLYKVNSKELCFNGTLNRNKSKLLKKI